ncbi:MAG: sulfotransferase [Pseudomonadota bacterium]
MAKAPQKTRRKIFCIGSNKTGTTTLHGTFKALGLRSRHDTVWARASAFRGGRKLFRKAQCFSDGDRAEFRNLDKWFSNALFILNTRDERAWLRSRVKHVMRHHAAFELNPARQRKDGLASGPRASEFAAGPEMAIAAWIAQRRLHERMARDHFAGNERFLELSVTDDPTWTLKLSAFLAKHGVIEAGRELPSIHANKRSVPSEDEPPMLTHYYAAVDRVLETVNRLTDQPHASIGASVSEPAHSGGAEVTAR